ncbi:MAG: hypothetical protein NZ739_12195, partial [Verrucomicrobiae bacterium]|nr:hypothetical protein [Verrucomicrobiae bacterium]
FDGRLIYSGGDDVLALLPADTALDCARALRMAFTGNPCLPQFLQDRAKQLRKANEVAKREVPHYQQLAAGNDLFEVPAAGLLALKKYVDQANNRPIPFLVPGPAADCSVGVAIAHFKHPLQDTVRAAQAAQKRAKKEYGRSAVAVTLLKRSGETIHWGCKWDSGGLDAYAELLAAIKRKAVSSRFPYRLSELVEPYLADHTHRLCKSEPVKEFEDKVSEILINEVQIVATRQRGPQFNQDEVEKLVRTIRNYLGHDSLNDANAKVRALMDLCATVAFIARNIESASELEVIQTAERLTGS